MTYATKRNTLGRQPLTAVELHLDHCTHAHGQIDSDGEDACNAHQSLTTNQRTVETDLTGFTAHNGATLTRQSGTVDTGSWALQVDTNHSAYARSGVIIDGDNGQQRIIPSDATTVSLDFRFKGAASDTYRMRLLFYDGSLSLVLDLNLGTWSASGSWETRTAAGQSIPATSQYVGARVERMGAVSDPSSAFYIDTVSIAFDDVDDFKCYNTRTTCNDVQSYSTTTRPFRFISSDYLIRPPAGASIDDYHAWPALIDVKYSPARIEPGKGLGRRGKCTVTIQDFVDTDRYADPYVDDRSWDPTDRGTFWPRFLKRHRYYQGRLMKVRTGYLGDPFSWNDFETRLFVIESITGPDANGRVTVTGKDILKLADDERAQAPAPSTGVLASGINDSVTTITLDDSSGYASSGTVRIGDELITYSGNSSNQLTGCTRGTSNTTAQSHNASDVVQQCLVWNDKPISDAIYELLNTYADISSSYLDKVNWDIEADTWLGGHDLTTIISEPTGVKKLLEEITEQCLCYIWWDEVDQLVKLQGVRPADDATAINDDDNVIAESISVSEDPDQRLSEVWVYYDIIDPTGDYDEPRNYRRHQVNIDAAAEGANQYDETRVRQIFARFFDATNSSQALQLGGRMIARYRDNPRIITLSMDAKDSGIWLGDVVSLTTDALRDSYGEKEAALLQVVEVKEDQAPSGTVYQYRLQDFFFRSRYCFISPSGTVDYASASDALRERYGWISPAAGADFDDGTESYKII